MPAPSTFNKNNPDTFFWYRVNIHKDTKECWEFAGNRKAAGYCGLRINNKIVKAHRYAYESFFRKKIPKGLLVCHKCDNPPCCNPYHLFIGTQKDNMQDMVKKGRGNRKGGTMVSGEKTWNSKFTEKQVREIRKSNLRNNILANKYNVSPSTISRIKSYQRWSNIK